MKIEIDKKIYNYYLLDALCNELGIINGKPQALIRNIDNLTGSRKFLIDQLDGPDHNGLIFSDNTTLEKQYGALKHYQAMIDLEPNVYFPKVRLYKAHFKDLKTYIGETLSEALDDKEFRVIAYDISPVIDIEAQRIDLKFPIYIGDINVKAFCNDPTTLDGLCLQVYDMYKKAYEMDVTVRYPLTKLSNSGNKVEIEYFANHKNWQNNLGKLDPIWKDSIFFIKLKKESSSFHQVEYLFFDVTDFKKLGDTLKTLRAIPNEETLKELFPHQYITHEKLSTICKKE